MQRRLVDTAKPLQEKDGDQGRGQGAQRQSANDMPFHMTVRAVRDRPEALGDGGKRQVRAHRDRRGVPQEQRQQGRHQRAAAYTGQADQQANAKSGEGFEPQRHE